MPYEPPSFAHTAHPDGDLSDPGAASAIHLSTAGGADPLDARRELLASIAEAKELSAQVRASLGTYTVELTLLGHRGVRGTDVPFSLGVSLCGGRLLHGGGDVTMFWCSRTKGKEADKRRLVRDNVRKWAKPLSATGCGAPIHPDKHVGNIVICDHCGLLSRPRALRHLRGDHRTLPAIAALLVTVMQDLGMDANLLMTLWSTDLLSPVFQTRSSKWDYEKMLGTGQRVLYTAKSIVADQHAGAVPLETVLLNFLSS